MEEEKMVNWYDLVYLEDERRILGFVQDAATSGRMSFLGVGALNELRETLEGNSRGRVYVVDGRFPEFRGGEVKENFGKAVDLIRQHHPDSKIYVYSLSEIADRVTQIGAEFVSKYGNFPRQLIEKIRPEVEARRK